MKHVKHWLLMIAVLFCYSGELFSRSYTDENGIVWEYTAGVTEATITDVENAAGQLIIPDELPGLSLSYWAGGTGGALLETEVNSTGGVDGGAYIRPLGNWGKSSDESIATAWEIELGKTYVFSFFMRHFDDMTAGNEGYVVASQGNKPREETVVLGPQSHVDANLAWTHNSWVFTADYTYLSFCARWLGGEQCFDAFVLAEVEEFEVSDLESFVEASFLDNQITTGDAFSYVDEEGTTKYYKLIGENIIKNASFDGAPLPVKSIGDYAFSESSSLTSIIIPSGITNIGNGSFSGCINLTSIISLPITSPEITETTFEGVDKSIPVYVPAASVADYQEADYWKEFSNIRAMEDDSEIVGDLSGLNKVGSSTFRIEQEVLLNYESSSIKLDIDNIAALLGCSVGDMVLQAIDSDGYLSDHSTANAGGYWLTENGVICGWGNDAFLFVEPIADGDYSQLNIGQMPGNTAIGEEVHSLLYLTAGNNYYELDITLAIVESEAIEQNFENMATFSYTIEAIDETYAWSANSAKISFTEIYNLIGTTTPVLYALNTESVASETDEKYTKEYNITERPGFWLTEDGRKFTLGNSTPWAITGFNSTSTDFVIQCLQKEGCGIVGDVYTGQFFLVNEENKKMITLNITYSIISETTTITLNQYGSGTFCSNESLDFSEVEGLKAYAATGYDTKTGIVTLTRVMTAKAGMGLFLKGTPGEYEIPVLENTSYNTLNMLVGTLENTVVNSTSDDGIYANYKYTIKEGDASPMFYPFADGSTLSAGKAYLQIPLAWLPAVAKSISLRFDDGETTDIEEMESLEQPSDVIYDLMGRRVTTPQRGSLYLINGKKIIY